jgi:carbon storage regulator CsrA
MRIYTRGENQSLVINREITITVLAVYPDHVHIGINSPSNTPSYWETDLYLPDLADAEAIELELTIN